MTLSMVQTIPETVIGAESRRQRFSALAREHYKPVYCFIARQVPNKADAADITQHVFVKGFKSFERFDLDRAFAPWIYTIARRCLVDFFRSNRPQIEQIHDSIIDPELNPREKTIKKDGANQLWELASGLKPQQHQVLLLHYKENFTMQETARIMGITKTHAKVLVFRARTALKKRIQNSQIAGGMDR